MELWLGDPSWSDWGAFGSGSTNGYEEPHSAKLRHPRIWGRGRGPHSSGEGISSRLAECGWAKKEPSNDGYFFFVAFFVAFFFVAFFAVAIVDITSLPRMCRYLSNGTSN